MNAALGPLDPTTLATAGTAIGVRAAASTIEDNWDSLVGDPGDPATPVYGPLEAQGAAELLLQPLTTPVQEVLTLTDEELIATDGMDIDPLTPTPRLDQVSDSDRVAAVEAARRDLVARGLLPADGDEPTPSGPASAQALGVLRRTADSVIAAERVTDRGTDFAYFFVFGTEDEDRVLAETVGAAGRHDFVLMDGETLPEQLLRLADPLAVAGGADGSTDVVAEPDFADSPAAQRLAGAHAITDIMVINRASTDKYVISLVAGPDGITMMEVDEEDEDAVRRIGVRSRRSLEALLAELL